MSCKECANFKTDSEGANKVFCTNYKPKDNTIYVPEGIEVSASVHESGVGLRFGENQDLSYSFQIDTWWIKGWNPNLRIKAKLTPCEYEDLEVGGMAYRSDYKKPPFEFKNKEQYCLIVSDKKYVWLPDEGGIKLNRTTFKYWWKVEQA